MTEPVAAPSELDLDTGIGQWAVRSSGPTVYLLDLDVRPARCLRAPGPTSPRGLTDDAWAGVVDMQAVAIDGTATSGKVRVAAGPSGSWTRARTIRTSSGGYSARSRRSRVSPQKGAPRWDPELWALARAQTLRGTPAPYRTGTSRPYRGAAHRVRSVPVRSFHESQCAPEARRRARENSNGRVRGP